MNRVMIVGCPRSGTTILQSILASHPDVLGIFESRFYCNLCSSTGWMRRLGLTPWSAIKILNEIKKEYKSEHNFQLSLFSSKYASKQFLIILDDVARTLGKRVWIEKTPQHLLYIDYIRSLVEGIKYIHIERKPESVISSIYHASLKYPHTWPYDSIYKSFDLWKESYLANEKYRDLKNHFFITLNELIDNPSLCLRNIFEFIEIDFMEDLEKKKRAKFLTIKGNDIEWIFESQKPLHKKERCRFGNIFDTKERSYISERIKEIISQGVI